MDSALPTAFETSAILQTEELGVAARFGDCDNAEDRRPWRRLTHFQIYCRHTNNLRQIQEVLEGADLLFSGTVEPYDRGGLSQRQITEVGCSEREGLGAAQLQSRGCKVKDIGPILERSFQGYGEKQLLIWISTTRAHYALGDPAEEYRPLFEPLQTEADLAAAVYNLLSQTPTLSAADLGARLPARLRPHFERLRWRVAQELLAFEFVELPNGARLKLENLDAIRAMSRGGKKRGHDQVAAASPSPKRGTKASAEPDSRIQQLVEMGYASKQARQAVGATRGGSVTDALDWILAKDVEAELDEAGSDITNTPPSNQPELGAAPISSGTPVPSNVPPLNETPVHDDDEDSSPPLRVNRRRRPVAEQGGVTSGTKLPPLDVDSSARTPFEGFDRIQADGAGRGSAGNSPAQPGLDWGLTGGLDAGLGHRMTNWPGDCGQFQGEPGVGAEAGGVRQSSARGVDLARKSTPVWRAESQRGAGDTGEECRVGERCSGGFRLVLDEGVPPEPSDVRPTEPAPGTSGRGRETTGTAQAERGLLPCETRLPSLMAFMPGGVSEGAEAGGAERRNESKRPEPSVCSRQSGIGVPGRAEEGPREEEASTGAMPNLDGLVGAGETCHVEAADLLSGGPDPQARDVRSEAGGAGFGALESGGMDGTERNQTDLDGSGRIRTRGRVFEWSRTDPEGFGWDCMAPGGRKQFRTEALGLTRNSTERGGTGLYRTEPNACIPPEPFERSKQSGRGGFEESFDFVSWGEEPGNHEIEQETGRPPFRQSNPADGLDRLESAADAPQSLTPPVLPKPYFVSGTPTHSPKRSKLGPVPNNDQPTAPFERHLPPLSGDELSGGVGGTAFTGGVDVPLLEAELLQEENHPGAILSLLGEEVEVLIDAFAIWWDVDKKYYTAKAVEYDPPSHRHKVKYLIDDEVEWVALWKEDVKILVEGEDYSKPDDIPLYLYRNGNRGPVKPREVEPCSQSGKTRKQERSCGAASEEEGPESEVDNEFQLDEDDVIGEVSANRRRHVAAARGPVVAEDFEQRWRPAVENGPRTFLFFFENVAHANRGQSGVGPDGELEERENVWDLMQRHLWGIPPEEINSVEYSVANRKRKYPHNIPRAGRTTLEPLAPLRISEVWPQYAANFPEWDRRKTTDKLNMINTKELHPNMIGVLNKILRQPGGAMNPSLNTKRRALIRSYNLIFTSPTSVANIREEEVETIMGFPRGHTRCGIPRSKVFELLGNSFQVDTIARLLSPLVPYFRSIPGGISVLSLFDGISGLGVALWRLGVTIKRYISVEIDEHCRTVVDHWWRVHNLGNSGELSFVTDIKQLTTPRIAELIAEGPFDLVAGGSPCNNLTGNNRQPKDSAGGRSGLLGRDSRLFLEFPRVLNEVERLQLRAGRASVVTS
ncbi:S-adenosyl-L-methionine-dependent methyltransferases superfamily protein [Klebsormidium nitens]|uniref:S-adenosyl-L-methionine-dependent methyltransferases superfamily protein n=1 Tax=Klebsormidium nitens TaxID=105231 RepID=A0A1Y1IAQ0_KLENI|nr:S-adenosyl-L-methionine-dependent methyltransferases superfamily protein [Klebsormidium nitens]|eukprot:GAQ85766.1 S-adenosyl-L-methionine-dependent methyltransferases superfamily protein [Klebsormidium nitens]